MMTPRRTTSLLLGWLAVFAPHMLLAAEGPGFVKEIQPLLRKHCYACHGHDHQEGGLRLDQRAVAQRGGENGKVIVPGKSADSLVYLLAAGKDAEGRVMPPEGEGLPVALADAALLAQWIDSGADWPDGVDPRYEINTDLWSLQPVTRPQLPKPADQNWIANPIDAFVLARLESAGLRPAERVEPHGLARRAAFDLTGLPLTNGQLGEYEQRVAANGADKAYLWLLDELLDSQHYGERWARHWLDVARYADSNGYEVDGEKPLAWQYRDYVIRSLNEDKPYDQFVLEQLAGDELPNATSQTVIATGFLRVGPWDAERGASVQPSEVVAERFNELDDLVSTTSQVFLGLTIGCARCHDHKFDPLSSRDYYSLVAVFDPLARHKNGRTELTRPAVPPRELADKNAADNRIAELTAKRGQLLQPLERVIIEGGKTKLATDVVAALKTAADKRTDADKQLLARSANAIRQELEAAFDNNELAAQNLTAEQRSEAVKAAEEIAQLRAQFNYPAGYFFHEPNPQPAPTRLLKRGNPLQPGDEVEPAAPAFVAKRLGVPADFEDADEHTSRRRISLARWIIDANNPLTSRVIVNRVWQYHFGVGLIRTPNDFGNRGVQPTHPQLLDWLADWFVTDANWSLKKLHRLIMTSSAYRMNKVLDNDKAATDPDNRLFWRFPRRRLEVEAIRDAVLAASGQLNRQLYGPCMYPKIPDDALRSGYDPNKVWKPFNERDASRRTIYAYVKRTLIVPFLETFDFCDTTQSTARRDITTVAPQALELLNGEFIARQSRHFAQRLEQEAGDDRATQIELAYRLALGRSASREEREALSAFVAAETAAFSAMKDVDAATARGRALAQMCRVVLNLSEFVYTD